MTTRWTVEIGGRTVDVALDSSSDGPVRATVDGEACDAEVSSDGSSLRVRVGATLLDLVVEWRKDEMVLHGRGGSVTVHARDRDLASARVAAVAAGPASVRAPMPGRIVQVLVAAGSKVAAGAPVVVVEAMKMENELRSPSAGTVIDVRVRPGQNVEAGEELVRIGA